jgi:hypothetical protein
VRPVRDDEVGGAEGAGDGGKDDAVFEVELGPRRVEQRFHIGENRPQRGFDVVARDRVVIDRLAGEAFECFLLVEEQSHCYVERRAAGGVGG